MKTIILAVILALSALSAVLAASITSNLTVTITGTTGVTFTSLSMSGLTFTAGTASTVGMATATLSSGTPAPTWSIKTAGNDSASGAQCNNYGADFTINSSTGAVAVIAGAPAQSYPGTCLQATQSGVTNSPYSKAFTLVGNSANVFTNVSLSPLTFVAGSTNDIGTATATLSSGTPSPTWSIKTSGTDSATGATCNNYGADFSIISTLSLAPSGPSLTTAEGTWTWGTAATGRPGEYNQLLNGTATGAGISMEVYNGKMYVNTASAGWFVYTSGSYNSTSAPPGPGTVTASASAPVQSYPGTCIQATQAGISNSPYSKAFTLVGSSGGAVPGPAAAAGFNQLIIDYDFTQTNPWSNRNNWLRCHDGSGAASPLLYQDWDGFGGFPMPRCSNISQATDPLGSQALHIIMDKASLNAMGCEPNCDGRVIDMTLQTVDSGGNGNVLPTNLYAEVVGLPKSSDPAMVSLFGDFWSYANDSSVEWDGIEWFGNNIGFATYHNNSSGNVQSTNENDSMDQSAYHKYAWRVTSNGSNDGYFCSYKDDAPAASSPGNCISWSPTGSQAANLNSGTVQFETGYAGCGSGGSFCPNSSVELWVRRLRVWSCAGINSGATCHSSSANP